MPNLIVLSPRIQHREQLDAPEDLARHAAEALETYRRGPWRQLSDQARLNQITRAIELLERVCEIERQRTGV